MIIITLEEFSKHFSLGRPIISIDYGNKKIGVAISTPDHKMCFPYKLVSNKEENKTLKELLAVIKEKQICAIVIGLPLNMDGSYSTQTIISISFAKKMAANTDIPIFMQDERLTSKTANNFLKNLGLSRKQRNAKDDVAAASLILETTLEAYKRIKLDT